MLRETQLDLEKIADDMIAARPYRTIVVEYEGEPMSIRELSERCGISESALRWRHDRGLRGAALTAPKRAPREVRRDLTQREIEVLRLMCEGKKHKEISRLLGMAYKTVTSHRLHIMQRTGCESGVQLGVWAVRNGIVTA